MWFPILLNLHPPIYSNKAFSSDFLYKSNTSLRISEHTLPAQQLSHTHRNTASPCLSPPLFTGAHLREGVPRHLEPWLCSLASGFRAPAPAFPRLANRQKQNLCRAGMDQTDCNPEALFPCCHQGPLITTPLPQPRLSNESSPIRANTLPVCIGHMNKVLRDLISAVFILHTRDKESHQPSSDYFSCGPWSRPVLWAECNTPT